MSCTHTVLNRQLASSLITQNALGADPAELAILRQCAGPSHHISQDVCLEVLADNKVLQGTTHVTDYLVAAAEREGQSVALQQHIRRVCGEHNVDTRILQAPQARMSVQGHISHSCCVWDTVIAVQRLQ